MGDEMTKRRREPRERPETRLRRAATRLIAHGGLHAMELKRLVKMARTSTSQFHAYFKCRENLFADVFNEGWVFMELCASRRLMTAPRNLPDFIQAYTEGLLDAFEEDPETASATLILGFTTIDQPVRKRLLETPGFQRYQLLAKHITEQLQDEDLTLAEAEVALNFLFGAIARQLLVLTPLYADREREQGHKFDRKAFGHVMRRMIEGIIGTGTIGPFPAAK